VLCFPNAGNAEDMYTSEGTGVRRAPSPLLVRADGCVPCHGAPWRPLAAAMACLQAAWALQHPPVQEWCRANGAECLAVQPPGRNLRGKEAPLTTCQALAGALVPVVASKLLEAPYVVRSSSQAQLQTVMLVPKALRAAEMCSDMLGDHPVHAVLRYAALRRLWRTAWAPGALTSSCAWRSSLACPCRPKPSCRVSAALQQWKPGRLSGQFTRSCSPCCTLACLPANPQTHHRITRPPLQPWLPPTSPGSSAPGGSSGG
jgi:hypothetical protein